VNGIDPSIITTLIYCNRFIDEIGGMEKVITKHITLSSITSIQHIRALKYYFLVASLLAMM